MTNIAIENGPVEIVDLPNYNMVIFYSYVNVYQRLVLGSAVGMRRMGREWVSLSF